MTLNRTSFAGSWYPASPAQLKKELDKYMSAAISKPYKVYGAVLPHAGHAFSGRGIAHFFKNTPENIERIVLLSPSHYEHLSPDRLYFGRFSEHETPLGNIAGDTALQLDNNNLFVEKPNAVAREHAAEMALPFIKQFVKGSPALSIFIVPEITDTNAVHKLGDALLESIPNSEGGNTLFIASSDFTHYGRRFNYAPFGADAEKMAENLDRKYGQMLVSCDIDAIFDQLAKDEPTICGIYPSMLLSYIMKKLGFVGEIADYYNSNSVTGRSDDFVCYETILYHQGEQ